MKINNIPKTQYRQTFSQAKTENIPTSVPLNQIFDEKFENETRNDFSDRVLSTAANQMFLGSTPVIECYKNFKNIAMLNKYVSLYPQLEQFNMPVDDILEVIKDSEKKGILLDYDFESKKEAIDNLAKFASKKENEKLMNAFGLELLINIIFLTQDNVSSFDKECLKNLHRYSNTDCYKGLFSKLSYDFMLVLGSNKDYSPIVNKNLDILEKLYKKSEYIYLIDNCINPYTLTFNGDLEKALEIFKEKYAKKKPDEVLKLSTNIESGNLVISSTIKKNGELSLIKNIYYDENLNETFEKAKITGQNYAGCKTENVYTSDKSLLTDYRYRQVYDEDIETWTITDVDKIVKSKNGKPECVRLTKKSDVDGLYNVKETHNGKIVTVCNALKKDNGISVNKNLISPEGVLTKYVYERSNDNSKEILFCIIKDVKGKILATKHSIYNRISDDLAINKVNDVIYKIEYGKDYIKVKNENTKEETVLDLKKLIPSNDSKLINLLKTISAPELIEIKNKVSKLNYASDKHSFFSSCTNSIFVVDNKFALEHELGHAKDAPNADLKHYHKNPPTVLFDSNAIISSDECLQKIYKEEKERLQLVMPKEERDFASYLLSETLMRPLSDVIAEIIGDTNAVLNTPEAPEYCAYRIQLYQENFPRTIAYIMNNYGF